MEWSVASVAPTSVADDTAWEEGYRDPLLYVQALRARGLLSPRTFVVFPPPFTVPLMPVSLTSLAYL